LIDLSPLGCLGHVLSRGGVWSHVAPVGMFLLRLSNGQQTLPEVTASRRSFEARKLFAQLRYQQKTEQKDNRSKEQQQQTA
jgi:hypothetical protein